MCCGTSGAASVSRPRALSIPLPAGDTQPPRGGHLAPAGLLLSLLVACGGGAVVLGVLPGAAQMGRLLGPLSDGLGFQPWLPTA